MFKNKNKQELKEKKPQQQKFNGKLIKVVRKWRAIIVFMKSVKNSLL